MPFKHHYSVAFLGDAAPEKVEEGRELDELMDFLKEVLLATEESALLKGSRRVVEKRRFGELRSIYDLSRALIFKGRRRMVDELR